MKQGMNFGVLPWDRSDLREGMRTLAHFLLALSWLEEPLRNKNLPANFAIYKLQKMWHDELTVPADACVLQAGC